MKITCRSLTEAEFAQALSIRWQVFVGEQNVPPEVEHDHDDKKAIHFGAFDQDQMIGTGRVMIKGQRGKIGRLAILKPYRSQGAGMQLLNYIVSYGMESGFAELYLGALVQAIGFYEKAGFAAEGELYDDAGIPHRTMRKRLKK